MTINRISLNDIMENTKINANVLCLLDSEPHKSLLLAKMYQITSIKCPVIYLMTFFIIIHPKALKARKKSEPSIGN